MPGYMGQIEILVHHLISMMLKQNDMINGFDYSMLKLYCKVYMKYLVHSWKSSIDLVDCSVNFSG